MCGIGSSVKIPLVAVYMKLYWSLCKSSMCHGCEVMSVASRDMEKFETFHHYVARRIQYLPERCATLMSLSGLGWWTLASYMDKRKLMFLPDLLDNTSPECYRGIVIHKFCELFSNVRSKSYPSPVYSMYAACVKYGLLDSVMQWLQTGIVDGKSKCKNTVNQAIGYYEYCTWRAERMMYVWILLKVWFLSLVCAYGG